MSPKLIKAFYLMINYYSQWKKSATEPPPFEQPQASSSKQSQGVGDSPAKNNPPAQAQQDGQKQGQSG